MAVECPNLKENQKDCACTYPGCERKGRCCECLRYHLAMRQLPGCCFPPEVERTYDRSIDRLVRSRGAR